MGLRLLFWEGVGTPLPGTVLCRWKCKVVSWAHSGWTTCASRSALWELDSPAVGELASRHHVRRLLRHRGPEALCVSFSFAGRCNVSLRQEGTLERHCRRRGHGFLFGMFPDCVLTFANFIKVCHRGYTFLGRHPDLRKTHEVRGPEPPASKPCIQLSLVDPTPIPESRYF